MSDQRPYKFTLRLTDKEQRRLTETANAQGLSRQKVIIEALTTYEAIKSGVAVLSPV